MINKKDLFFITDGVKDFDIQSSFLTQPKEFSFPLYIGYHKTFSSISFQLKEPSEVPFSFSINGQDNLILDFTEMFSQDGDIQFDIPSDWVKETHNGREAYWVKIDSVTVGTTINVKGIGNLFVNDRSIDKEYPSALGAAVSEQEDRAKIYRSVTETIMEKLVSMNLTLDVNNSGMIEPITSFDLLKKYEVRKAATYLALSKILLNATDSGEDVYQKHGAMYEAKYENTIKSLASVTIDSNDDGKEDVVENRKARTFGTIFLGRG